jgi:lipopolysaccharide transport system permease protein
LRAVAAAVAMGYRPPLIMNVVVQAGARDESTLELIPDQTRIARHRMGLRDLQEALGLWRLCWTLAWLDIKLRYRGSMLGPFWLTLSTAIMVVAMGFIYSALFRMDLHLYLPFLALSLVLWNFLATLVGDSCTAFTAVEGMIRSVRMPFSLYAARIVVRNLLVFAHNIVVIVGVDLFLSASPGAVALAALPAFVLWLVDALALAALLGALCARFRDIPPIVANLVQMAFFITPVIWKPELMGARQWLNTFNPFYTWLEIVRRPLLGELPPLSVYGSALGYSLLLCALSWLLFARVRGRIAFWV